MPTIAEHKLSLEEFHARYDCEKPHYEYWDGEAVQKAMPTVLHSVLQAVLTALLWSLGFKSGPEIRLKLDPDYEPVPDVIAIEGAWPSLAYPTEPFEIVVEILSPEDSFSRILRKCRLYEKWGIRRILVVDPTERIIYSLERGDLRRTEVIAERAGRRITAEQLWKEVDAKLSSAPSPESNPGGSI
jgi:Uma2 family endonuclease